MLRRSARKRSASVIDAPDNQGSLNMPSPSNLARGVGHASRALKKPRTTRTSSPSENVITSKSLSKNQEKPKKLLRTATRRSHSISGSVSTAPSPPRQTTSKKIKPALSTPHPTPERWKDVYAAITEMRKKVPAPVDGMGCANAGDVEINPKVGGFPYSLITRAGTLTPLSTLNLESAAEYPH